LAAARPTYRLSVTRCSPPMQRPARSKSTPQLPPVPRPSGRPRARPVDRNQARLSVAKAAPRLLVVRGSVLACLAHRVRRKSARHRRPNLASFRVAYERACQPPNASSQQEYLTTLTVIVLHRYEASTPSRPPLPRRSDYPAVTTKEAPPISSSAPGSR
jgi:hypothetical protein